MLSSFAITQRGQSHIDAGTPGQDYSQTNKAHVGDKTYILSAVSDGVGSCTYSQYGSETAVKSIIGYLSENIKKRIYDESEMKNLIKEGFEIALEKIEEKADEMKYPFLQFDCTLTVSIYDGENIYFGHVGDGGIVALYDDGTYEMITERHKGEEAHSVFPLRCVDHWDFGVSKLKVASFAMMTDGVLDGCVSGKEYDNRVYWPFLQPALTIVVENDEQLEFLRNDWNDYFEVDKSEKDSYRKTVTDDITFLVVLNSEKINAISMPPFDFDSWNKKTREVKKRQNEALYREYNEYLKTNPKKLSSSENQLKSKESMNQNQKDVPVSSAKDNKSDIKDPVQKQRDLMAPLINSDKMESFVCDEKKIIEVSKTLGEVVVATYEGGEEIGRGLNRFFKGIKPDMKCKNVNKPSGKPIREDSVSYLYETKKKEFYCRVLKDEVVVENGNPDSRHFQIVDKMIALCDMDMTDLDSVMFPLGYDEKKGKKMFSMNTYRGGLSLSDIMYDHQRNKLFKSYNKLTKMKLAYNLCSLVYKLHSKGIIIGDMNPQYFYYMNGTLYFTNTEEISFVDSRDNRRYFSNTVFSEIAAPELLNINMLDRRKQYSFKSDYFSLAILVFWLMTDGGHPFGCTEMGLEGEESNFEEVQNDCITKGISFYFARKNCSRVDEKTKRFEVLPEDIKELFSRTFNSVMDNPDDCDRTTAKEWCEVLLNEINNIEQ